MERPSKEQFWGYFILAARLLLAWTLIGYGRSKLIDGQFGVTEETMNMALKNIDLFRLSWYLADHEPFKSFVGISQIVAAIMLLFNRTVILGAFIAIPIWANILIWDMTFMGLYTPFTVRLPFYLLLTFLILWYNRDRVFPALQNCTRSPIKNFKYPIWAYLVLPVFGICLEFVGAIPILIINFFK